MPIPIDAQQFRDLDRYVLGKNRFGFGSGRLSTPVRVAVAESPSR